MNVGGSSGMCMSAGGNRSTYMNVGGNFSMCMNAGGKSVTSVGGN